METSEFFKLFAQGFMYLTLLIYTIYAVIFGYHWFTYGSSRKASTTALIVFLVGGGIFFATLFISFTLL